MWSGINIFKNYSRQLHAVSLLLHQVLQLICSLYCICTSMQKWNMWGLIRLFMCLVSGKINAFPLTLSCPQHVKWMEWEDEEEENGTSGVYEMDAMQMALEDIRINLAYWNKWVQLSPAMTGVFFFSLLISLLAAPIVILINPPTPNPWASLSQTQLTPLLQPCLWLPGLPFTVMKMPQRCSGKNVGAVMVIHCPGWHAKRHGISALATFREGYSMNERQHTPSL